MHSETNDSAVVVVTKGCFLSVLDEERGRGADY